MFNKIEEELTKKENTALTENGAVGYKSSGSALLNLNYQVSSLRNKDKLEIIDLFTKAFRESPEYTLKWLFFARDIREGLGERRLFRICYKKLAYLNKDLFLKNLNLISEFGRWDDLVSLINISNEIDDAILEIIQIQIVKDIEGIKDNKPISLLGKWLPSENASSRKTKYFAHKIRSLLSLSSKEYRLLLSKLRKHIRVVERKMCANEWESIDYERVPSLANLKYKNAFLKHDLERRRNYLELVNSGERKINMNVATPVDIISKYRHQYDIDETLEIAWKNLKDIDIEDTLVVADGSGSMQCHVGGSIAALDVAMALAIYTSEHNTAPYRNKYITFSNSPQFVNLSKDTTLKDKIGTAKQHNEIANTNIEAVFNLILELAIGTRASQEEMIKNVLIISDMEFDRAQQSWRKDTQVLTKTLFEKIQDRYNAAGYRLPKLIFWNVNSRTNLIPIKENEMGIALVSGFSQNVLKMVMSNKYDPLEILLETLDQERYNVIKTR